MTKHPQRYQGETYEEQKWPNYPIPKETFSPRELLPSECAVTDSRLNLLEEIKTVKPQLDKVKEGQYPFSAAFCLQSESGCDRY